MWARYAHDQVITGENLDWVRTRHPGIQIVLCSASPKPMLEVACEELGTDAICYSTHERINSGVAKIDKLRQLCVGAFEPNAAGSEIRFATQCLSATIDPAEKKDPSSSPIKWR